MRPLYKMTNERRIAGLKGATGLLQRRPMVAIFQNPAAYLPVGDPEGTPVDLLLAAGNGWTQGTPTHEFRWHTDGSLEFRGYLTPGTSGTVAYTLPGAGVDDVDYRPARDVSFLADVKTGPSTFSIARVEIDSTTGDVTITFPAS